MAENTNNWTEKLLALVIGGDPLIESAEHYDSINTTRKRIGKDKGYKFQMKTIQNQVYTTRKS
jgi:hypothetical protein